MKIKVEFEITQEMVEGLIVTALEGGSNYWYNLDTSDFRDDLPKNTNPLTERIAEAVYKNPYFKMPVYDIEDDEELLGYVSQKTLIKGLETCAKEYPDQFRLFISMEGDAGDADVVFQVVVMGEVVFG